MVVGIGVGVAVWAKLGIVISKKKKAKIPLMESQLESELVLHKPQSLEVEQGTCRPSHE